jgi:hypothetical protein
MQLLIPHSVLNPRKPDEHFQQEMLAAQQAGWHVAFFDHDAAQDGRRPLLASGLRAPDRDAGPALIRSWMLTAGAYQRLETAVRAAGVQLVTSPDMYRTAHHLPGWQHAMTPLTPPAVWTDASDVGKLVEAARSLPSGAGVLKDHVKALKHLWEQACFVPDVHDAGEVRRVADAFLAERGRDLQGGLVLRVYEDLHDEQVRTWWMDGTVMLTAAHPDTPHADPSQVGGATVEQAAASVASLGVRFVTVDWMRRTDGRWRVIEVGDGQVSGLPDGFDPADLFAALSG